MFLHPDAARFVNLLADAPPLDTQTPEQNRADLAGALPMTGETTPLAKVYDATIADVPVRVYHPTDATGDQPAFVYIHGGGWVIGDLELADTTVRQIAAESGAIGISIDYRLAPENPFPAAVDDCVAVVRAILAGESGINVDPAHLAVCGDSAGGNLSAVVAQQLRSHSPALKHQVLIYPVTNASTDTESYSTYAEGFFLTRRDMEYYLNNYIGDADPSDPRISPLRNPDLAGLPPATFVIASNDPLLDDGLAYAKALQDAGNKTTVAIFAGQVHPFVFMGGVIEDALAARRFIAAQLKAALN